MICARIPLNLSPYVLNGLDQSIHGPPPRLRIEHHPEKAPPLPRCIIYHKTPPYQTLHKTSLPSRLPLFPPPQPPPLRKEEADLKTRWGFVPQKNKTHPPLYFRR